jgi:glycosyltransferase involved in cell wall biosynthesis
MNNHKTLILFSPAFPQNQADSIWLPWLQIFVKAINKNFPGLTVIIIAFQYPHTSKIYSWHGNKIIPFNGTNKSKLTRFLMWIKIFLATKKITKTGEVVGIFSLWCGECTFVAKHISDLLKIKYFCWIAGQDARASNTYVKRIHPKASSLIAMSDFLADEFYKNHGIKPAHVITNGIDISLFDSMPSEKDIDIIGVGSLSFLKRYDVFVEVIAALKISIPNIKAVLCGDGEAREQIKKMIGDLSLNNNIILKGTMQHAEVLKMMQRSKILLHSSSYEGFSGVCLEALYAGAHVISFVRAMHHEIKNWHIVNNKDEMQIKALEILQSDIKHKPVLAYSMDESAKKIMQLF